MYENPLQQFLTETPLQNLPQDASQLLKTYQSINITIEEWNSLVDFTNILLSNVQQAYTGLQKTLDTLNQGIGTIIIPNREKNAAAQISSTATGAYSIALGNGSEASGKSAHAEGGYTSATADNSHAEGYQTEASGNNSHAEGSATKATGNGAHAEGYMTEASGENTHAEGASTKATTNNAHAEGQGSIASGEHAHAEGWGTIASGVAAHTEGTDAQASGNYSHAEGKGTQASGNNGSHAEGQNTQAIGTKSHAEGESSISEGPSSHAEGIETYAIGNGTHTEGYRAIARNNWSHAEGVNTETYNKVATDWDNMYYDDKTDLTYYNSEGTHAEGARSMAGGVGSHAEGVATKADGFAAHSEGYLTTASRASHAEGYKTTAISTESGHIEGHSSNQGSDFMAWQTAILSEDYNSAFSCVAGDGAHVEGCDNYGLGHFSHTEGKWNIAYSLQAHAEGQLTQALGDHSHTEGVRTIAYGAASHAGGEKTTVGKLFTNASGIDNNATGEYARAAFAHGLGLQASAPAQAVFGKYNQELEDALFIVGNGTGMSDEQRHNAFVVGKDGNAYVGNDRKKLATVDEVSGAVDEVSGAVDTQKYLTYYNYRAQEMTAYSAQADTWWSKNSEKKVGFLSRDGVDQGDFYYVLSEMQGVTHVIYHPFRTGELINVDIDATQYVLVPRGITKINTRDWGMGVLDLTAFGKDTPFPTLDTEVGSLFEVLIPRGRFDEICNMTNWCGGTIAEVDVSDWFN